MNVLSRYILSVICVVTLCGLVRILFSNEKNSVVHLVTGLIVTLAVLTPLLQNGKLSLDTYFEQSLSDGDLAIREGSIAAQKASAEFIKEKSEAYILSRAEEMGANVSVEIEVSDTDLPIPAGITVTGFISPYTKTSLSRCIQKELGISEDEQIWIS